jgi:hypothetical protein
MSLDRQVAQLRLPIDAEVFITGTIGVPFSWRPQGYS